MLLISRDVNIGQERAKYFAELWVATSWSDHCAIEVQESEEKVKVWR